MSSYIGIFSTASYLGSDLNILCTIVACQLILALLDQKTERGK
jgi:hypothetical protein